MYSLIAISSIFLSCLITRTCKKEPVIFNSIFIIYLVWHLPLVLSIILPFSFPLREEENNFPYILFFLVMIHIIIFGGVYAWIKWYKSNRILFSTSQNTKREERLSPIYLIGAFSAPIILAIDNFLIKGVSISLDLSQNRDLATSTATLLSLIGVFLAGLCLYLLNWTLKKQSDKVQFNIFYLLPFIMTSIVITLTGNRQFLFLGVNFILFKSISIYRPKISHVIKWLLYIIAFSVPFGIGFQFLRQSALEGQQDIFIISIMKLTILNDHLLVNFLYSNKILLLPALYIYVYFGTQYDTLSATIRIIDENMPFTSLTLPVLYRRWNAFFNLPDQDAIVDMIYNQIESEYGIFPAIWNTMFAGIYLEGGILYIVIFSLLLCYIHFNLTNNYLNNKKNGTFNLIIFYMFMSFGIITIGTYEVPFFFLILQALISSMLINKNRRIERSLIDI